MSLDILQYRKEDDPRDDATPLPKVTAGAVAPSQTSPQTVQPSAPSVNPIAATQQGSSLIGSTENPIMNMLEQVPDQPPLGLPADPPPTINPYQGDLSQMSVADIQALQMPGMIPSDPEPQSPQSLGLPESDYNQINQGAQQSYEREKLIQEQLATQEFENPRPFYVYPDPTANPNPIVHKSAEEWFNEGKSITQAPTGDEFQMNPFTFSSATPFSSSVTGSAINQSGGMVTEAGKGLSGEQQFSWNAVGEDLWNVGRAINPFGWVDSYKELFKGNWKGAIQKSPTAALLKNVGGDAGSYGKGLIGNTLRVLDIVDNTVRGATADALGLKRVGETGKTQPNLLRATVGAQDYSMFQTRTKGSSPFALIPENFKWNNPGHVAQGFAGFMGDMALSVVTGGVISRGAKAARLGIDALTGAKTARTVAGLNPRIAEVIKNTPTPIAKVKIPTPGTFKNLVDDTVPRIQQVIRQAPKVRDIPTIPVPKTLKQMGKYLDWKTQFDADLLARNQAASVPGKIGSPIPIRPTSRAVPVQLELESGVVVVKAPQSVPFEKAPLDTIIQTKQYPTVAKPRRPESLILPESVLKQLDNNYAGNTKIGRRSKDAGIEGSVTKAMVDDSIEAQFGIATPLKTEKTAVPGLRKLDQKYADTTLNLLGDEKAIANSFDQGSSEWRPSVPDFSTPQDRFDFIYGKDGATEGIRKAASRQSMEDYWTDTIDDLTKKPIDNADDLATAAHNVAYMINKGEQALATMYADAIVRKAPPGRFSPQEMRDAFFEMEKTFGRTQLAVRPPTEAVIVQAAKDAVESGEPLSAGAKVFLKDPEVQTRLLKAAADEGVVTVDNSGNIVAQAAEGGAVTPEMLDVISPVIKPHDITPLPSPSDAVEALRGDPDVLLDNVTSVPRTNKQLTDLAVFMGHVKPRKTPLSATQLKALEETHGSIYSKFGRAIDSDKLTHPMVRIEVQPANPLDNTPQVTRLVAPAEDRIYAQPAKNTQPISEQLNPSKFEFKKLVDTFGNKLAFRAPDDVAEQYIISQGRNPEEFLMRDAAGNPIPQNAPIPQVTTLKQVDDALAKRSKIMEGLDEPGKVVELQKANDELINLGNVDYRNPETIKEIKAQLPSDFVGNNPVLDEAAARTFEIEDAIADVTEEVRQLKKELENLAAGQELDEIEFGRYADDVPDGLEGEIAYSRDVWDMADAVTPDYVPFKTNPDLFPDELEGLVGNELPKFNWFHGTRVDPNDVDIRYINPDDTKNIHELGTGVYFTTDAESAAYYAKAQPSQNLPEGVSISDGGTVHRVLPEIRGATLVANMPPGQSVKDVFRDAAIKAGAHLDVVQSFMRKLGQAGAVEGLWDAFYDTFKKTVGSNDMKLFHRFQVNVANGLRNSGYEAILKLPEKQGDEAVLNVLGRGGEPMPFHVVDSVPAGEPNLLDALAARVSAEKIKGRTSGFGKHAQIRSRMELTAQLKDDLTQRAQTAVNRLEDLFEQQQATEELLKRGSKQEKDITRAIRDNGDTAKQAEEMKYYDNGVDLQNPCLED